MIKTISINRNDFQPTSDGKLLATITCGVIKRFEGTKTAKHVVCRNDRNIVPRRDASPEERERYYKVLETGELVRRPTQSMTKSKLSAKAPTADIQPVVTELTEVKKKNEVVDIQITVKLDEKTKISNIEMTLDIDEETAKVRILDQNVTMETASA